MFSETQLTAEEARHVAEGSIGLGFSVILALIFLFRLGQHLRDGWCFWTKKRIIHGLLVWFCILQIIRYSFYLYHFRSTDPEEIYGYTCHLLSVVLLVVAYILFITLWGDTLRLEITVSRLLICLVVFLALLFLGLVLSLVVAVWISGHIEDLNQLLPYKMIIWAQACIFVIASAGFLAYGLHAHASLQSSEKWQQVLSRLNLVMGICTVCAGLRVSMLILLFFENSSGDSYIPDRPLLWLAFSQWIPFYGLLFVIQYVTRRPETQSFSDTAILWGNSTITTSRRTHTGRIDEEEEENLAIALRKSPPTPNTLLYGLSSESEDSTHNEH